MAETQAHYYRVRNTTNDMGDRPDFPASVTDWVGNRGEDGWWLCMTATEVSMSESRGAVIPIPDLPTEAQGLGIPFAQVRDHWLVGGVGHPDRQVA